MAVVIGVELTTMMVVAVAVLAATEQMLQDKPLEEVHLQKVLIL